MAVEIRALERSDFAGLVENYYACYDERAEGRPIGIGLARRRPSYREEAQWFSGLYRRVLEGSTVAVVAADGATPMGLCTVSREGARPDSEVAHVGELGILVGRRFRGRGVGSALLRATLKRCRGRFEVVRLSIFAITLGAQRLYRRLGFRPCGRVPRGVRRDGVPIDIVLMATILPSAGARGSRRGAPGRAPAAPRRR